MDTKLLMKTAGERIRQLDSENAQLRKEAAEKKTQLDEALSKLARHEREKSVDHILDILIEEKHYFPQEQRNEKKAYLMDPNTDLNAFQKMAEDLNPREPGMFYEATEEKSGNTSREDGFCDVLINKLAHGLYGN